MGGPGFRYPTYLDGRIECIPQQLSKRARKQRRIVAVRLGLSPPLSIPSEREGEIEGGVRPNAPKYSYKSPAQCQCPLSLDHHNGQPLILQCVLRWSRPPADSR